MGFRYRWKPSASQKRAYHEKMVAIEKAKDEAPPDEYTIGCTGDCCKGDEIAFFNAGKSGERLFGVITAESYGAAKQQHTFTIDTEGPEGVMRIKGRNLYKMGVVRKKWPDEAARQAILDEKHKRGDEAREAAKARKEAKEARMNEIPDWAMND
jgi:hypothetical protein